MSEQQETPQVGQEPEMPAENKPTGPATANALAAGAARRVEDADALVAAVGALLADRAQRLAMGQAALAFHAAHRGAAERLWQWLAPRIAAAAGGAADARVSPTAGG